MLPEKFKERMQRLFDENEYNEFLESFNLDDSRHHALRINTLKAEPSFKDKLSFLEEKVKKGLLYNNQLLLQLSYVLLKLNYQNHHHFYY